MTGLASVRHIRANSRSSILRTIRSIQNAAASDTFARVIMITGHTCRRSLYYTAGRWHRERQDVRASQAATIGEADTGRVCQAAFGPARNTANLGQWATTGSAIRTPASRMAVTDHATNTELLSLDQLARELGVHQRTLRAAARTGRLQVTFSSRSAFGRPIRLASRAAGRAFIQKDYRRYGGQSPAVAPLPFVPEDYDDRLRRLRRRFGLTQHELARRIRAANKAVVYQWESRKRTPSPVFWQRVEALDEAKLDARRAATPSKRPTHVFQSQRRI